MDYGFEEGVGGAGWCACGGCLVRFVFLSLFFGEWKLGYADASFGGFLGMIVSSYSANWHGRIG